MRIIAGEFRGRRLLDPADDATRPVTDRVKQRLFDILAPRLPNAIVWDVFAGTGSFGLESLSRGAASAVFFERHRPAIERLRKNIATLGVGERCRVVTGDVFRLDLQTLPAPGVVCFDPPYRFVRERRDEVNALLHRLADRLTDDGIVLFRHDAKDDDVTFDLAEVERRAFGSMTARFFGSNANHGEAT